MSTGEPSRSRWRAEAMDMDNLRRKVMRWVFDSRQNEIDVMGERNLAQDDVLKP